MTDDGAAAIATKVAYATSASLATLDFFDFLNEYAGAIGVCIGVATFLVNLWFRVKEHQDRQNNG